MKIYFNRISDKSIKDKIKEIFETALYETKTKNNISVNITIVGQKTIKLLNHEYRNVDKVTDVLSFPLNEAEDFLTEDFASEKVCSDLGDIVICKKVAYSQAKEYAHSKKREI